MIAAIACLVAVCCATVSAILAGIVYGHINSFIAAASLAFGTITGLVALRLPRPKRRKFGICNVLVAVTFGLFALRAFCWVAFFDEDNIKVLSPNNLGDLPLHLTFINYIAKGAPFWPDSPIFSGMPLHYPLGMDVFNALLKLAGMDVYRCLVWVALIASAVTFVMLRRWGGVFVAAGFLFNGGLAAYRFLGKFRFADYNDSVAWKSIPLSMFVTQRGLLYAIPAGLLLLISWRARWFSSHEKNERLPFYLEVLFYSTLPLFHLHTFIFLSVLLACWIVAGSRETRAGVLKLLACSFVPATIFVMFVTGLFHHDSASPNRIIHFTPGWMQGTENPFRFWSVNFGLLPLFVAVLIYLGLKNYKSDVRAQSAMAFVIPAIAIFLCACFVMLAPWEWDNTKIMIWSYLTVLPFLWEMVISKLALPGRIASCLVLFFSGFISLFGGLDRSHTGYEIARRSEVDSILHVTKDLSPSDTFAAFPTYNHPLLITGNKLVEGYDGHLFSYGIDYQPRLKKLDALMMGEPNWRELAQELRVRYLFWGDREREHYDGSRTPWRQDAKLIASGAWGEIYDLSK